jgi:hypothetical protein
VTDRIRVRLLRGLLAAALIVTAGLSATAAQAQEEPPLEDVTLRGRILRPDGKPLANTPLRVDAVKDEGFALFSFFATFGLSTLTCFAPESAACPIPSSKRFNSTTDADGRYSFTFPNAHYRGEQTNTDYYLSVAMPSAAGGGRVVVGSYELELWDAVHDAPDVVMWDPSLTIKPGAHDYGVEYKPRPQSSNRVRVTIGDDALAGALTGQGSVDARAIEDQTVSVVLNASKDERAVRTIYHQRFVSAQFALRGGLVPLSRGAACSIARSDGSGAGACNHTDGDLVAPGFQPPSDDAPAECRFPLTYRTTTTSVACPKPYDTVTIDLGAAKQVGEVRTRCGCAMTGSVDGTAWRTLPTSGVLGSPQSLRYVRVTGPSAPSSSEISVWPPWPDGVAVTPLVPDGPAGSIAAPVDSGGGGDTDGPRPWLLAAVALAALVVIGRRVYGHAREA